ncbi:MAG: hypothetical protein LBP79_02565 [Clostridiales bacterium]|nr:hypothetical protein [Clostridiales bacterium]
MIMLGKEDVGRLKDTVDGEEPEYEGRVFRECFSEPCCTGCGFRYAVYVSDGYGLLVSSFRGVYFVSWPDIYNFTVYAREESERVSGEKIEKEEKEND